MNNNSKKMLPPGNQPQELFRYLEQRKKLFEAKTCLHPLAPGECHGKKIRSHTVQRARSLQQIAKDQHVLQFRTGGPIELFNNPRVEPVPVGLNNASTFFGFCEKHDSELFAPLDHGEFTGSPEQTSLHHYRAICFRLYARLAYLNDLNGVIEYNKKRLPSWSFNAFLESRQQILHQARLIIRDLEVQKLHLDEAILAQNYSRVHSRVYSVDSVPPFMTSTGDFVDFDFNGRSVQDHYDEELTLQFISQTIFSTGDGGFVLFAWDRDSAEVASKLLTSLDSHGESALTSLCYQFAFAYAENLLIGPAWWESLQIGTREAIIDLYNDTKMVVPYDGLMPRGIDFQAGTITRWKRS